MEQQLRVAVVGDQPLFRFGVVQTLATQNDIVVAGQGASVADAVHIAVEVAPDVILLDLNLPDAGAAAAETIAAGRPGVHVLILSVIAREQNVAAAMQRGVRGYLLKDVSCAELITCVRAVGQGERYLSHGLAAQMLMSLHGESTQDALKLNRFSMLTLREQQVLALVKLAMSNKEIAIKVELTEKTVKHYLTSILRKLHVRNRVEAALLASQFTPAGPAPAAMDPREIGQMVYTQSGFSVVRR